jgi:hypothetical protein
MFASWLIRLVNRLCYAFAYTNVDSDAIPSFNVAGGAEARDNYHDHIVRRAMSMPLA